MRKREGGGERGKRNTHCPFCGEERKMGMSRP